jgi:hypothetical protein
MGSSSVTLPRAAAWVTGLLIILIPAFRLAVVPIQAQAPELPSQAASIDLEGELEVEIEDHADTSQVHHFIRVGSSRVRLALGGQVPGWQSGTRIRARGRLANNTLELSSSGDSMQVLALANSNTFGEQRVAVILVNFASDTSQPYTTATASSVTFGTVSDFFRENSYGQTWLTGQVFGWYNLPFSLTSCDYSRIATESDKAAAARGVDLSRFTRRIYAFPKTSACSWWGLGGVGGNPSRAWINGTYSLKVVAHELGHNFGDYHSNSQPCSSSGCYAKEYGDNRDMMGQSSTGHFNAFQKERLGWLNYGTSPPIQNVTSAGTYWIEGYGVPSTGGPKALRILKSTDSYGRRTWYYVESRARAGYDSGFTAGVTIHTGSEAGGNTSLQMDVDRTTTTFDALLDPGQVFADAALDLAITTRSVTDAGAFVDVSFPGAPCESVAPTVTADPGSATTPVGSPVSFTVSVRNNDSAANCSTTTFSLAAAVPSGWTASYDDASLTVPPGATVAAQLTLTPSSATTTTVNTSASRVNTAGPGGSDSVTVTAASSSCSTAAPTVAVSPGTATTKPGTPVSFTVSIRNNDSTTGCASTTFSLSAANSYGWPSVFAAPSLKVAPGATASTSLTVTPSSTGTTKVTASAARSGSSGSGGSGYATLTSSLSSLSVSLSIVKTTGYVMTATVKSGTSAVPGAPVKFSVRNPLGATKTYSATTNSSGVAKVTVWLRYYDPKGIYTVAATASAGGLTGTATGSFSR